MPAEIYIVDAFSDKPILIGTWADASWAISFYEKNGYGRVSEKEKNRLLKRYWSIPERQVETSVVLSNQTLRQEYARKDGEKNAC